MVRRIFTLLGFALALELASGCGVQSVSDSTGGGGSAPNLYVPDASNAGEGYDASGDTVVAQAYKGSPLCNASFASGCYPDEPTTTGACRLSPDGGAYVPSTLDTLLGCHVLAGHVLGGDAAVVQPACLPAGSRIDGYPCLWPTDCAPTYECVGEGTCQRYCCQGNGRCPRGPLDEFCDILPLAWAPATKVPVCMPTHPCTLLDDQSCSAAETCAVVREDGTTSCVAVGPANVGDGCDDRHCTRGLVCLGGTGERHCNQLCHTGSTDECAAPQACKGGLPLFPDPTIGICQ